MERVASIPLGARVYLERQILTGSREARFLRGTYEHPLGRSLSFEHAIETGVAIFRGRLVDKKADTWTARLDDSPDAISLLFAEGLRVGLRGEDGTTTFFAQTAVLGATVDGDVFLSPPSDVMRMVVRRYPRLNVDLRLDVAGVRCQASNVSGSGALVVCPNTLSLWVGEIVHVLLHLPSGPSVAAAARVMRSGRDPFGVARTALMFVEILASDRDRIVNLVARETR